MRNLTKKQIMYWYSAQGGGGYSDEYQAVYDAFPTKPSSSIAALQNKLMEDYLVASGAWSIMDWFVCLANESEDSSRIDWKSLVKTVDDEGTGNQWGSLKGIKGNGSGYLSSNFIPATHGANIGKNDSSYMFCTNLDVSFADEVEMGANYLTGNFNMLYSGFTDGKAYARTHTSGSYLNAPV